MRVVLPGISTAFYLKRQHRVTWRERFRNRLAGFGWSSRCVREAAILKELSASALPAPQWVAVGEDNRGRAFLLVEEVTGATDLRQVLSDNALSLAARRSLAHRLGRLIGRLHAAGVTTPDLTAKHLLISPDNADLTPIDWQSARRVQQVQLADRVQSLATLHASVADHLASPRERLRVLRAALGAGRLATLARRIEGEVLRIRERRSIRDQRQHVVTASAQRLVWVAEEAVCAVPDVAANWPKPAIVAPFYGCEPGTLRVQLPDGHEGVLIRGHAFNPLARLRAKFRGRSWRSPGANLGRLLFHLERYGVPAPRLLAFGQRLKGFARAEWFTLHEIPGDAIPGAIETETALQLGRMLRQLHDAGCRPIGEPLAAFAVDVKGVSVRDVTRVRLARKVTSRDRAHDLASLIAAIPVWSRSAVESGYHNRLCASSYHQLNVVSLSSDRLHPVALG